MHGEYVQQAYDCAASMSGHLSGTATRIKAENPLALNVHCANHCLQLVLLDGSQNARRLQYFGNV